MGTPCTMKRGRAGPRQDALPPAPLLPSLLHFTPPAHTHAHTPPAPQDAEVRVEGGPKGPSWVHQPLVEVEVEEAKGFVQFTLVKVSRA